VTVLRWFLYTGWALTALYFTFLMALTVLVTRDH
jgi:hypothetical protein